MRPLLFILGLAFVATVLVAHVNAIKCYQNDTSSVTDPDSDVAPVKPVDCGPNVTQCVTWKEQFESGGGRTNVYCGTPFFCGKPREFHICCDTELCNRIDNSAVTSPPSVPLLIAVIASMIAALGI